MSNAFEQMIIDIFSNKDFLETCIIKGTLYDCIITAVEDGINYTDAGLVDEEAFTLDIKLPFKDIVKTNDTVKFRSKMYKISRIVEDSAFKSAKLYLIAISKGITA